jgi:LacI family transcriptional regulator
MDTVFYFKNMDNQPARRKLSGVLDFARKTQWNIQVISPNTEEIDELLEFWRPIGCIVNSASGWNNFDGSSFGKIPTVFIDRPPRNLRPTDSYIYHDSAATVQIAMRELLSASPRTCAYVRWPVALEWDKERLDEFMRIAKMNGCPHAVFATTRPVTDDRRIPAELSKWLLTLPRPVAVLASADPMGAHVINACRIANLRIPEDVAICGIDNDSDICEATSPSMTSVAPDHKFAGYHAGEMLLTLLQQSRTKEPFRDTYANAKLQRRGSTARLLCYDQKCAAAFDLIRRQACDGISASAVTKMFGCSRRNAEYRFRAATGKSILQAIREVRLEKAKSMLMDDSIRLDVVANACGYESTPVFAAFFKTETGHSPRAWRKLNT